MSRCQWLHGDLHLPGLCDTGVWFSQWHRLLESGLVVGSGSVRALRLPRRSAGLLDESPSPVTVPVVAWSLPRLVRLVVVDSLPEGPDPHAPRPLPTWRLGISANGPDCLGRPGPVQVGSPQRGPGRPGSARRAAVDACRQPTHRKIVGPGFKYQTRPLVHLSVFHAAYLQQPSSCAE